MPYDRDSSWQLEAAEPNYTADELACMHAIADDLKRHMKAAKPKRYDHSLSVARTAERMACIYGENPYLARIAGLLHDWDKVLSPKEQMALADELGIDLGVDAHLVQPLLHGMTAARHLPDRYPTIDPSVWQAIERHTIGNAHMSRLDMIIFVADGIEPIRRDVDAIHDVRMMVDAREPLEDVYWTSFYHGVSYVIETQRYLYPGTLDIYNELALQRKPSRD
ncbi:MAG: bis(5'-nucleosyl)-tetraphosphatase (symmetrical) YqeK [Atopobiaceae bacterium]|nr:bis(5'-nucleosyl)-tetraphosphatase (symmetrical) YqeK [Atopobiaceae bacterium]